MAKELPKIIKNINDFLTEEEGSINKKNAVNLAITAVVLGASFYGTAADAHNSYLLNDSLSGKHASADGTHSVPYHTSNLLNNASNGLHNSHTSHSSCHSEHSSCHCSCSHSSYDVGGHTSTPEEESGWSSHESHSSCC